jgi:hypothetical protein
MMSLWSTMTLSGSLVGILVNDELFVIFCVVSVTIPGSSMLVEFANHYTTDAEGSLHITLCILKNTQITFVLFVHRKSIAENIPIRLLLLKFEMNSESCLVMMVSFIIYYIYTVQINNKLLFQNSSNM